MLLPTQKKLLLVFIVLIVIDIALAVALIFIRGENRSSSQPLQSWLGYQQQVDKGSLKPVGQILEVHVQYDNAVNPFITITDLQKKNGYVPIPTNVYEDYVLELLDGNKILYRVNFNLPEPKKDPPPLPGQPTQRSERPLSAGKFILTVPWNEEAKSIRITDANLKTITTIPLSSVKTVNNMPSFKSNTGDEILNEDKTLYFDIFSKSAQAAVNNHLDIVIVSDGYSDLSKFHSDVSTITKYLLTYEPYKSKASQLAFHTVDNTSNLNCEITDLDRLLTCDDSKVVSRVNTAGAPYDAIYVLVNQTKYGGSGGGNIGVGYNGDFKKQMFAHEFGGHVIGNLYDEYNYDETTKGSILNRSMRNCYSGTPPNPDWQGLVTSTSYTKGCSYYNWYRSTPDSVMYSFDAEYYNAVSQKLIRDRIAYFVSHSNSGIVTPTPTKKPTATPTKKPTATPTPQPTVTPTPRTSPTATPTRSPFPTPTFYCVGACVTPTPIQSRPTPTRSPRPTSRADAIRIRLTTTPIPTPPKLENRNRSGIERFRVAIRNWVIEIRIWIRNLFNWR